MRNPICRSLGFIVVLFLHTVMSQAQLAPVDSVKVTTAPGIAIPAALPECLLDSPQKSGKRVVVSGTLFNLVSLAYGKASLIDCRRLREFVLGGPEWIKSDRFQVEITLREGSEEAALPLIASSTPWLQTMLQTVLRDRFKLAVHETPKEFSVYVLTVEPGGKLKADTGAPAGANFMLTRRLDESGRPYGEISIVRSPIAALVQQLKGILGELVIDKTGLAERFTLDVEFDNVGTARPPLTTALREAGLKLEFLTVPMDVVVIDAVQKP